jgi:hypothetical protein
MQTVTPEQVKAALSVVVVLGETIRDLGRPVPSGELFAQVCGHLDFQKYTQALRCKSHSSDRTGDRRW